MVCNNADAIRKAPWGKKKETAGGLNLRAWFKEEWINSEPVNSG